MIVAVRIGMETKHVAVNNFDETAGFERDSARKIAFRFVHKRRETDYNELVHSTNILTVVTVEQQTAEVLRSM